jgi:hypothetical protein
VAQWAEGWQQAEVRARGLPCGFNASGEGVSMEVLDLIQWPAMAVTLAASWLVASKAEKRRLWGFWVFLASNALWIAWGWHSHAYALIALQLGLAVLNIRGAKKNDSSA